jgi:hypothetical protein
MLDEWDLNNEFMGVDIKISVHQGKLIATMQCTYEI